MAQSRTHIVYAHIITTNRFTFLESSQYYHDLSKVKSETSLQRCDEFHSFCTLAYHSVRPMKDLEYDS